MIHRESRDRLAEALRRYVSGHITNDDLDDVEVDWRDRGAVAVKEMAWYLYDDLENHYVENRLPRGSEDRKSVARWIAFLQSDQEYIWPEYSFIEFINWPMNILTLGWWERMKKRRWEQFLEAGDFEVWPFASKEDLSWVLARPKFLSGKKLNQEDAPDRNPVR
jgi:hypothetical protein